MPRLTCSAWGRDRSALCDQHGACVARVGSLSAECCPLTLGPMQCGASLQTPGEAPGVGDPLTFASSAPGSLWQSRASRRLCWSTSRFAPTRWELGKLIGASLGCPGPRRGLEGSYSIPGSCAGSHWSGGRAARLPSGHCCGACNRPSSPRARSRRAHVEGRMGAASRRAHALAWARKPGRRRPAGARADPPAPPRASRRPSQAHPRYGNPPLARSRGGCPGPCACASQEMCRAPR